MLGAPDRIVPLLIFLIIGWRVISRIRRNIGRQPVRPPRLFFRIGFYAVITLFLAFALFATNSPPLIFAGLTSGMVLGALLGLFGLRLTRFETTAEGHFYTPNSYMGVGVSFLLAGRLVYRYLAYSTPTVQSRTNPMQALSPLTLFFYGVLAGYYIAYFIGVLVKSKALWSQNPPLAK